MQSWDGFASGGMSFRPVGWGGSGVRTGEVRLGFKSGGRVAVPPVCLGLAACGHRTIVLNRRLETTAGVSRSALC